jgi:hypothetical protein
VVWLRKLRFDGLAHAAFVDYLTAVEALVQRRSALGRALAEYAPQSPGPTRSRSCAAFGINTVTDGLLLGKRTGRPSLCNRAAIAV